jgi:hypothetical protein
MTSDRRPTRWRAARTKLTCLLAASALSQACALRRPPAPEAIECEEIDRAEERFPDECGEAAADAGAESDAAPAAEPGSGE